MKKSDKLFLKIGLEKTEDDDSKCIYECVDEGKTVGAGDYSRIVFDKRFKAIDLYETTPSNTIYFNTLYLEELKAIKQKIKELRWRI